MEFTAQQISEILGGVVEGNASVKVNQLSKIEEGTTGSLSFLSNPKYTNYIYSTEASIVIVNKSFIPEGPVKTTLIKVDDAYQSFAKLLQVYSQIQKDKRGIEPHSFISPSAKIGKDVYVGSFAYIGHNSTIGDNVKIYPQVYVGENVIIKENTTLYPGAKIYSDCIIGANCSIHADSVIGADGFGFAPSTGSYEKIVHIGNVVIEDYVEIGANTSIDRATLGSTIIRRGVKLDNLIQVGHNSEIGENTVIAAQTGIAGSTKIGKNCMIGGQVGIVGHITIADGVKVAAQSGIGSSILTPGEIVQGSPAFNIGEYKRTYVLFRKLPELEKKIIELEKVISNLRQTTT